VSASASQALQDNLAALKREISEKSDYATVNILFEELKNALRRIGERGACVEWQHSTTLGGFCTKTSFYTKEFCTKTPES
jgi:hypothetical protein